LEVEWHEAFAFVLKAELSSQNVHPISVFQALCNARGIQVWERAARGQIRLSFYDVKEFLKVHQMRVLLIVIFLEQIQVKLLVVVFIVAFAILL